VPSKSSVKQRLRDWLAARQPAAVTEAVWRNLLSELAPVSESYLRDLLRDTGLPFDQPWAGIRQHTFEELEQSLHEMLRTYQEAVAAGDRARAAHCRRQVIAAKDRAKYMAGRKPEKAEMAEWMLVWLENPEVFPAWVKARRRQAIG
jgi:DNA-binding GntR family transcriptional regulator